MKKIPPAIEREMRKATKLYKQFHWGIDWDKELRFDIDIPDVVYALGYLRALTYQTRKKGDKTDMFYIHALNPPLPILASNNEGNQLFILGGGYRVKKEGIIN